MKHTVQLGCHIMITPPGRPIVSDYGSKSYEGLKYIVYFLKPLANKHSSYVKNTSDFLNQ